MGALCCIAVYLPRILLYLITRKSPNQRRWRFWGFVNRLVTNLLQILILTCGTASLIVLLVKTNHVLHYINMPVIIANSLAILYIISLDCYFISIHRKFYIKICLKHHSNSHNINHDNQTVLSQSSMLNDKSSISIAKDLVTQDRKMSKRR